MYAHYARACTTHELCQTRGDSVGHPTFALGNTFAQSEEHRERSAHIGCATHLHLGAGRTMQAQTARLAGSQSRTLMHPLTNSTPSLPPRRLDSARRRAPARRASAVAYSWAICALRGDTTTPQQLNTSRAWWHVGNKKRHAAEPSGRRDVVHRPSVLRRRRTDGHEELVDVGSRLGTRLHEEDAVVARVRLRLLQARRDVIAVGRARRGLRQGAAAAAAAAGSCACAPLAPPCASSSGRTCCRPAQ